MAFVVGRVCRLSLGAHPLGRIGVCGDCSRCRQRQYTVCLRLGGSLQLAHPDSQDPLQTGSSCKAPPENAVSSSRDGSQRPSS